jgi:methyl-accepting chemotaxis protein
MGVEYQSIIGDLKRKIELIISKYEQIVSENKKLESELANCKYALENSINNIKDLEEKVNRLQIAEAFKSSSQDVKEAKQRIGRIVKEIDKCIALLND